jgi:hypothetical protein
MNVRATIAAVCLSLGLTVGASTVSAQQPGPAKPAPTAKPAPVTPADKPAADAPGKPGEAAPADGTQPDAPAIPPLSDALTGDAKADYDSGKLLYGDGDFAGALVKFGAAHDKSKDARLLWNMAAAEKNLRHYAKALALVRRYQAEGGALLTDADKNDAAELIKVIEPLTAKLRLKVSEPGASVTIDDDVIGQTPVEPVTVDIGTRRVQVTKPEFEPFTKDVPVGGAAEIALDVALVKIVHEGKLIVRAPADSTISIDGKVVGTGTYTATLPSGGHSLRVTAPKMLPYQSELYIQDKQTREVPVTLQPEPSKGLPLWAWLAGGAVVAGGLVAGGIAAFGNPSDKYEGPSGTLSPGVVQANHPFQF